MHESIERSVWKERDFIESPTYGLYNRFNPAARCEIRRFERGRYWLLWSLNDSRGLLHIETYVYTYIGCVVNPECFRVNLQIF